MRSTTTDNAVKYHVLASPVRRLVVINVDLSAIRFVERLSDEIIIEVPLRLHKGVWVSELLEDSGVLLVRPPHSESGGSVTNTMTGNHTGVSIQAGHIFGNVSMRTPDPQQTITPLRADQSAPIRIITPPDFNVTSF